MSKVVELHGLLNKLTGLLNISYIFADLSRKVFTDIKEEEMASIRFHVALAAAKISKVVIRLLGRNATHTPGVIALKICPDFLAQAPKAPLTICVTGTNGKTTCSNMITDILEKDGRRVVSNRTGSNIVPGCVTLWNKCGRLLGLSYLQNEGDKDRIAERCIHSPTPRLG